MGIRQEREVARADMNDQFGVTVFVDRELVDLSIAEAVNFAGEILHAANEALRIQDEDETARAISEFPNIVSESGEPVL